MKTDLASRLAEIWFDRPELLQLAESIGWLSPLHRVLEPLPPKYDEVLRLHTQALAAADELKSRLLRADVWLWLVAGAENREAQRVRARQGLDEVVDLLRASVARIESMKHKFDHKPRRGRPRRTDRRQRLLRALDDLLGPLGVAVTAYREGQFALTYAAMLEAAGAKVIDPLNDIRLYLRMV